MERSPFRPSATVRVEPSATDAAYREASAPSIAETAVIPDAHSPSVVVVAPASTYEIYVQLVDQGMSGGEAANLTALTLGIYPTQRSWTVEEINRLLFLRDLDRRGCLG
jgi:hypothetical protein